VDCNLQQMQASPRLAMESERAKKALLKKLKKYVGLPLDMLLSKNHHQEEDAAGLRTPPSCVDDVMALFHAAAELVPAYQKFLAENGVSPSSIVAFRSVRECPCCLACQGRFLLYMSYTTKISHLCV